MDTEFRTGALVPVQISGVITNSNLLKAGLGIEPLSTSLFVVEQNGCPLGLLQKVGQLNSTIIAVGSCEIVVAVGAHRKIWNNEVVNFEGLPTYLHSSLRWATTADYVRLKDTERVLAVGDALTPRVCLAYVLCLSVFITGKHSDRNEVNKKGNRIDALLGSDFPTAGGRDISVTSEQPSKVMNYNQRGGDHDGDDEDVVMFNIFLKTIIKLL